MSLLRRRMMMQTQAENKAKYPFVNGRHDFSDGSYVEVTNGNHVHIKLISGYGFFINVSNVNQNTDKSTDVSNIDGLPKWFSLKAGDICELKVKNIIKENVISDYSSNFRIAELYKSSVFGCTQGGSVEEKTVQITLTNNESFGCYFFYITSLTEFECDVEFYVNGERYI